MRWVYVDSKTSKNNLINSIIGEGSKFSGDIEMTGLFRIDGDFSGSIKIEGKVLVGQTGRVECDIHADTVVIGGAVKGNIFSENKIIILSTGLVVGNIQAPLLIVEEGVLIHGNCLTGSGAANQGSIHRTEIRNKKSYLKRGSSYTSSY